MKSAILTTRGTAAEAGVAALQQGGNAVDAAVAAMMVQCVIQPQMTGFGGYGGSMAIYLASEKKVHTLDFDSRAPLAFKPELYTNPKKAQHGYLSTGVPGNVAGFDLALRQFGKLNWKSVSHPAIKAAEDGFILDSVLKSSLDNYAKDADPASLRALFGNEKVPTVGSRWKQPDLAKLIRTLGDQGATAFYEGDIPRTIVKQIQANGGILSEEDFRRFKAQIVEPLHIDYRGHDIYTPPPPSGGLTSLAIAKTIENLDLTKYDRYGAQYFELFIEATKLCWQERDNTFGDPDVVPIPIEKFLSKESAASRADRIRHGDHAPNKKIDAPKGNHTANIVAIDKDQNIVSLTSTHGEGFGGHIAIEGLGLVLGHGMSRFTYKPNSPNFPAPGKRVQHNMSPVVVLKDGKPFAGVGLPGGQRIVTVTAQLLFNLIDFAATATQAVKSPRAHIEAGIEPIWLSGSVPEPVAAELEMMGHTVKRKMPVGGNANVALINPKTADLDAANDRGPEGVRFL